MITIAQQLKIKEFPFKIKDSDGKLIYFEDSDEYWSKYEYDSKGNRIYFEDSDGYAVKYEYDSNGDLIYWDNSDGYGAKYEYNFKGDLIYFEDSNGTIIDNRSKRKSKKPSNFSLKKDWS